MSRHQRFRQRDDVVSRDRESRLGLRGGAVPLLRNDETEVRKVLRGLAREHGLTVSEVAGKLERGMWSRDHWLGSMKLQWTFEKMCEREGFADGKASDPPRPRGSLGGHKGPRAA